MKRLVLVDINGNKYFSVGNDQTVDPIFLAENIFKSDVFSLNQENDQKLYFSGRNIIYFYLEDVDEASRAG